MINLKVPVNVNLPTLLHSLSYSSGSNEKAYQQMLKYVTNQDKIKTEKFRRLLPFIREKNSHLVVYKTAEKRSIHTQENGNASSDSSEKLGKDINELTNVVDILSEVDTSKLRSKTPSDNTSTDVPLETTSTLSTQNISKLSSVKGISTLVACTESSVAIVHADLSTAALPLSLHRKDDNFLVAAVVQDVNHMYFKFAESVDHWSMLAQQEGLVLYGKAEEFLRQYEPLQDLVREQTATLMHKSTLWFADKESAKISEKAPVDVKKTEKSTVSNTDKDNVSKTKEDSEQALSKMLDKIKIEIKKAIEMLTGLMKKKMSEDKKSVQGK